jgi:hypothetical protein
MRRRVTNSDSSPRCAAVKSQSGGVRNLQGTFRKHPGNIQKTFREHSGNIQGTFREHSGNIQRTFREHSGNIQGTFREHSGMAAGNQFLVLPSVASVRHRPPIRPGLLLLQGTTFSQGMFRRHPGMAAGDQFLLLTAARRGVCSPSTTHSKVIFFFREHSGNIQGTFREYSGNIQGPLQ